MKQLIALETNTLQTFIDNPASITTEDISLQIAVASHPDTPRNLLEILASSDIPEVAEAAQLHVNYAGELSGNWQDTVDEKLKSRYLGQNDRLAVELLKIAPVSPYFLSEYVPADYLIQGLNNPHLPLRYRLQLLARLAQEPTLEPRLQVAESPETPLPVLEQLIGDLELSIRIAVQYNPKCPSELVKLVTGQHDVASNWDTDSQQLENLSNSNWDWIRLAVAQNPSASEETLLENYNYVGKLKERFSKDKEFSEMVVEQWLNSLPTLSQVDRQKVISKILEMSDILSQEIKNKRQVKVALVGNPHTPVAIREELTNKLSKASNSRRNRNRDRDLFLALAYNTAIPKAERTEYLQRLITEGNCAAVIAKNPLTPVQILDRVFELGCETKRGINILEALAKNYATPELLLRKIADLRKEYLWRFLAENPNTPTDLLIRFITEKVEKTVHSNRTILDLVLANPNLPILNRYQILLEQEKQTEVEQSNQILARRTDSPYALARVIETGNQSVKLSVARKHKTPIKVLEQLAKDEDEMIRQAIAQNPSISLEIAEQLAQDKSIKVQLSLLRSKIDLSPEILHQLAQSEDRSVRQEIAKNKNTPSIVLRYLVFDKKCQVEVLKNPATPADILAEYIPKITNEKQIESVLRGTNSTQQKNPNMPSEILEQLSHHRKNTIRFLVALYPTASSTTLKRLASDSYQLVRQTVAENPNTPPDVLVDMAKASQNQINTTVGSAHSVAYKIAARKDTPAEALDYLVKMPVSTVRLAAVRNNNISLEALEWLIDNETEENVLSVIAQNPQITPQIQEKLASNSLAKVRQNLASNPNTTSDNLTIIALTMITEATNLEVQKAVASHPNTPINFLENLSEAINSSIRASVASNPNLPQYLIEKLARDKSVEVRRAVANNPNVSESIKELLTEFLPVAKTNTEQLSPTLRGLSRIYKPETDDLPTLLSEYVNSDVAFVRFISLLHPLTPIEILTNNANSVSWIERYAVADNPNTPTEIKQQLTQDSNQIVRAVAMYKFMYKLAS